MNTKYAIVLIFLFIAIIAAVNFFSIRPRETQENATITLQPGFEISTFAGNVGESEIIYPGSNTGPRMLNVRNGILYASVPSQDRIVAFPDKNNDGRADEVVTVISGLNKPHGFDFLDDWIYVAEENAVRRFKMDSIKANSDSGEFLASLPAEGHSTRTLKIHNNSLYVSIGSSCNVCIESDERRAAILKCTLDGNCTVYAKGLRNAVGFIFNDGQMYATDNGRDLLGDDVPPEEVNIVEEGKNYGWPICYGNKIHDVNFDKNTYIRDPCEDTIAPLIEMQAHSAPLGLAFYENDLLVAFHGSWNRREPTGYKVVRISLETRQVRDFASDWLSNGKVFGRPVDVLVVGSDIYISDDSAGKIYRVYKA